MIFPGTVGTLDIIIVPSFNKDVPMIHKRYAKSISPIINRALQHNAIEQAMAVTLDGSILLMTVTWWQGYYHEPVLY